MTHLRIECYYNLHKECFSVRYAGRVISHLDRVRIRDAQFVVQPAGRARVLAEGKKNVHAFVRGWLTMLPKTTKKYPLRNATYNPYKYSTFVDVETKKPLYLSSYVTLINGDKPEILYEEGNYEFDKSCSASNAA